MLHRLFRQLVTRRDLLQMGLGAATATLLTPWLAVARRVFAAGAPIPTRPLGQTGERVTILGLGGEGVLRTWIRWREASRVIERALDRGITYCDTAPAYSRSQDYYGAVLRERRQGLFLASKTHDRSREGSLRLLDESLERLKTDHLDLWQLHDLRSLEELDQIFGAGGAIHAMEEAKRDGRIRFLGITGHHDPAILREAIRRYPFDTVLVALNAADRARLSFIEELLPLATERGMGVIGMKVLAHGDLLKPHGILDVNEALRYVLSLSVSTVIIGFSSPAEVDAAVEVASRFAPLTPAAMAELERRAMPYSERFSTFKRSA